jgi:lipopolysaccharide/colanic/teichoic acid biosynthesis glycosyltransferase
LSTAILDFSLFAPTVEKLAFLGLTSTFGFVAFLLNVNRKTTRTNLVSGSVLSNASMILVLAVVLLFSRVYYSRPYVALFFIINTMICYVASDYTARRRHQRVAFLTPKPSPAKLASLGEDVQINTDPKRRLDSVDLVLVDFQEPLPAEFGRAVSGAALAGLPVMHVAQYLEEREGRVSLDHVADGEFWANWRPPTYAYIKRLLDIAIIMFVAPVAVVLFGLASLAVLVAMGRPIFFKQARVSKGGSLFTIYKLRTMAPSASDAGETATRVDDQRITPIGGFLRRYRLDELPQLWNVLRGDMSVIGPRPEQPRLVEQYEREIPYFSLRHMVRPGISGWAQVKYGYAGNAEESSSKLAYDLYYIKNLSLEMDLQILLHTMKTVIIGNGAR